MHVPVAPRCDVTLLNAILRVLLDEGLVDLDAARPLVSGLDELLAHLAEVDLAAAADESGVGLDDIRRMALTIGRAERCLVAWSMGVNHPPQGTEHVPLLNPLCVLTGNIRRPGAAPFSIPGQLNAIGRAAVRERGVQYLYI